MNRLIPRSLPGVALVVLAGVVAVYIAFVVVAWAVRFAIVIAVL